MGNLIFNSCSIPEIGVRVPEVKSIVYGCKFVNFWKQKPGLKHKIFSVLINFLFFDLFFSSWISHKYIVKLVLYSNTVSLLLRKTL